LQWQFCLCDSHAEIRAHTTMYVGNTNCYITRTLCWTIRGFNRACARIIFSVEDKVKKFIWKTFDNQDHNNNYLCQTNCCTKKTIYNTWPLFTTHNVLKSMVQMLHLQS
jgi:hypothetical protein